MKLPVRLKKFLSSSVVYFLGNGFDRAVPFFLLPLLTRWLTTADYGFIGTFNAIRANVQPAIGMSSTGAVNRAYVDRTKPDFDFSTYIFNAVLINFVLFNFVLLVIGCFWETIKVKLHFPPVWIFLLALICFCSALSKVKLDLWVYQDRPWIFGFSHIFLSLLNIGLSLFLLQFFWMDWRGRIFGIFLAELVFCCFTFFLLWKEDKVHVRFRWDYMKSVLAFGLPLYPHSVGHMMIAASDKFFLNVLLGMEVLGVYTVGYTFSAILMIMALPFDMATSPRIYNMLRNNKQSQKEQFVCLFAAYFSFFFIFALFLSTVTPWLLRLMVGEKFHGAGQYIFWIVMGQFFLLMYRIPSRWINFARKNYHFSWITFTSGLVAVVGNYILIPRLGAVGAAKATLLAYASMFILTSLVAQCLFPMPWRSLFKVSIWRQLVVSEA